MSQLAEQIWREDITDQQDYVRDCTKVLHSLVQRAQYQAAPPVLVDRLIRIREMSAQLLDELEELKPYFPPQP